MNVNQLFHMTPVSGLFGFAKAPRLFDKDGMTGNSRSGK